MKAALRYTAACVAVAALVGGAGAALGGGAGVWAGVGIALGAQLLAFWTLWVWALPEHPMLAHGLGVLVRFAAVGAVAVVLLSLPGLAAAPVLFSMVGVLFLTTLLELLVLPTANSGAPRGGAVSSTTER